MSNPNLNQTPQQTVKILTDEEKNKALAMLSSTKDFIIANCDGSMMGIPLNKSTEENDKNLLLKYVDVLFDEFIATVKDKNLYEELVSKGTFEFAEDAEIDQARFMTHFSKEEGSRLHELLASTLFDKSEMLDQLSPFDKVKAWIVSEGVDTSEMTDEDLIDYRYKHDPDFHLTDHQEALKDLMTR